MPLSSTSASAASSSRSNSSPYPPARSLRILASPAPRPSPSPRMAHPSTPTPYQPAPLITPASHSFSRFTSSAGRPPRQASASPSKPSGRAHPSNRFSNSPLPRLLARSPSVQPPSFGSIVRASPSGPWTDYSSEILARSRQSSQAPQTPSRLSTPSNPLRAQSSYPSFVVKDEPLPVELGSLRRSESPDPLCIGPGIDSVTHTPLRAPSRTPAPPGHTTFTARAPSQVPSSSSFPSFRSNRPSTVEPSPRQDRQISGVPASARAQSRFRLDLPEMRPPPLPAASFRSPSVGASSTISMQGAVARAMLAAQRTPDAPRAAQRDFGDEVPGSSSTATPRYQKGRSPRKPTPAATSPASETSTSGGRSPSPAPARASTSRSPRKVGEELSSMRQSVQNQVQAAGRASSLLSAGTGSAEPESTHGVARAPSRESAGQFSRTPSKKRPRDSFQTSDREEARNGQEVEQERTSSRSVVEGRTESPLRQRTLAPTPSASRGRTPSVTARTPHASGAPSPRATVGTDSTRQRRNPTTPSSISTPPPELSPSVAAATAATTATSTAPLQPATSTPSSHSAENTGKAVETRQALSPAGAISAAPSSGPSASSNPPTEASSDMIVPSAGDVAAQEDETSQSQAAPASQAQNSYSPDQELGLSGPEGVLLSRADSSAIKDISMGPSGSQGSTLLDELVNLDAAGPSHARSEHSGGVGIGVTWDEATISTLIEQLKHSIHGSNVAATTQSIPMPGPNDNFLHNLMAQFPAAPPGLIANTGFEFDLAGSGQCSGTPGQGPSYWAMGQTPGIPNFPSGGTYADTLGTSNESRAGDSPFANTFAGQASGPTHLPTTTMTAAAAAAVNIGIFGPTGAAVPFVSSTSAGAPSSIAGQPGLVDPFANWTAVAARNNDGGLPQDLLATIQPSDSVLIHTPTASPATTAAAAGETPSSSSRLRLPAPKVRLTVTPTKRGRKPKSSTVSVASRQSSRVSMMTTSSSSGTSRSPGRPRIWAAGERPSNAEYAMARAKGIVLKPRSHGSGGSVFSTTSSSSPASVAPSAGVSRRAAQIFSRYDVESKGRKGASYLRKLAACRTDLGDDDDVDASPSAAKGRSKWKAGPASKSGHSQDQAPAQARTQTQPAGLQCSVEVAATNLLLEGSWHVAEDPGPPPASQAEDVRVGDKRLRGIGSDANAQGQSADDGAPSEAKRKRSITTAVAISKRGTGGARGRAARGRGHWRGRGRGGFRGASHQGETRRASEQQAAVRRTRSSARIQAAQGQGEASEPGPSVSAEVQPQSGADAVTQPSTSARPVRAASATIPRVAQPAKPSTVPCSEPVTPNPSTRGGILPVQVPSKTSRQFEKSRAVDANQDQQRDLDQWRSGVAAQSGGDPNASDGSSSSRRQSTAVRSQLGHQEVREVDEEDEEEDAQRVDDAGRQAQMSLITTRAHGSPTPTQPSAPTMDMLSPFTRASPMTSVSTALNAVPGPGLGISTTSHHAVKPASFDGGNPPPPSRRGDSRASAAPGGDNGVVGPGRAGHHRSQTAAPASLELGTEAVDFLANFRQMHPHLPRSELLKNLEAWLMANAAMDAPMPGGPAASESAGEAPPFLPESA
ncbi:hypothetical protein V8E36_004115 [Tilletia maclaganii]